MKTTSTTLLTAATAMALVPGAVLADYTTTGREGAVNSGGPKVIMDNDWAPTAGGQFLMALDYGWDVLGLIGDTANSWARQCSLHGLALLEIGGLDTCTPVHKGSDYPLLMTPKLMQRYEDLQGPLVWEGVFKPMNLTAEKEGADPTSGDPSRLSPAAFTQGFPNGTLAGVHAAAWMVDQVRKYPGEVTIWSGGALTNIALAVRMDAEFASLTKGLYVMGGFLDVNLLTVTGDSTQADINTDINFKADPEATKIALTADFPNITLVSQASNAFFPSQAWLDDLYSVKNNYTQVAYDYTETFLPLWDEATSLVMVAPDAVLNQTSVYVNVDTSYYSPTYGNIWTYQESLVPPAQDLREVNFVQAINGTTLMNSLTRALQYPKTCP